MSRTHLAENRSFATVVDVSNENSPRSISLQVFLFLHIMLSKVT